MVPIKHVQCICHWNGWLHVSKKNTASTSRQPPDDVSTLESTYRDAECCPDKDVEPLYTRAVSYLSGWYSETAIG
jgi:hypothetical protein